MICGRIIWGLARFILAGIVQTDFTVAMFVAGGVTNAIPGIILHLILIPIIVVAMERAGLVLNGWCKANDENGERHQDSVC